MRPVRDIAWRNVALLSGLALVAAGGTLVIRSASAAASHKRVAGSPRGSAVVLEIPLERAPASAPPVPTYGSRRLRRLGSVAVRLVLLTIVVALAAPLAPLALGWQVYAVEGASMEPSIPLGSLITVRPTSASELEVGDVITFVDSTHRQSRITHRVSAIDVSDGRKSIRTRGDANTTEDVGDANTTEDVWEVSADQPIARAVYFIPLAGYMLIFLSTMQARLMLVGLIAALLISQALPNQRRSAQA
jgi:signal peptidase I